MIKLVWLNLQTFGHFSDNPNRNGCSGVALTSEVAKCSFTPAADGNHSVRS